MPQAETQEKALVRALQAAVDNVNASFDAVHRAGMVVSTKLDRVEIPNGRAKLVSMRLVVDALKKVTP